VSAVEFIVPVAGTPARYEGLDLLSTAVLLLDAKARIVHVNQAAELLFDASRKTLIGQPVGRALGDEAEIRQLVVDAEGNAFGQRKQLMELRRSGREPCPTHRCRRCRCRRAGSRRYACAIRGTSAPSSRASDA
jgi:nitrogen-specific signal transduction histidine kinase